VFAKFRQQPFDLGIKKRDDAHKPAGQSADRELSQAIARQKVSNPTLQRLVAFAGSRIMKSIVVSASESISLT